MNSIKDNTIVEMGLTGFHLAIYRRSFSDQKIEKHNANISLIDDFLKTCYSRRSVERPILEDIRDNEGKTPEAFYTPQAS